MKGLLAEVWGGVGRHPDLNHSGKPLPPLRMKSPAEETGEWELWRRDCLAEAVIRQRFRQGKGFRAEAVGGKHLDLSCLPPILQCPAVPIIG